MIRIAYHRGLFLLVALGFFCAAPQVAAKDGDGGGVSAPSARPGTITGSVRDNQGRPLVGAIISLLRDAAGEELVRRTHSDRDGSFAVRTAPGRYILRVVAEGFTTAAFTNVEVGASAELTYRFDLIPAGQGRTAPEQANNRNDSRHILRSAHGRRSIFQADEHDTDLEMALERIEQEASAREASEEIAARDTRNSGRVRGLVETYYVASSGEFAATPHAGVNFALVAPVGANLDLVVAGQTGTGDAPQRLETTARARFGAQHRVSIGVAAARLPIRRGAGRMNLALQENDSITESDSVIPSREAARRGHLAQISMRATEEWTLPRGVVVVLGFDYARFLGAGDEDAFAPRFGVQFDMNARTRLRAAYAPAGSVEETRTEAIGVENGAVSFSEPTVQPIVFDGERATMERSRRMEFGIERVLDNRSSIEATVFLDTTDGRGVGLLSLPVSSFANDGTASVIEQQGAARGVRVVYARRLTSAVNVSAGYSFGRGQRLAPVIDLTSIEPDEIFESGFFQTAAAQVDADVREGTRVRAVLRFSSRATVFAIDPFAGRLAIYDPSLSFLVTQELPTFGLPVRAEAVLDARNLLDTSASAEEGDTILIVGTTRRSVRGGIAVRF